MRRIERLARWYAEAFQALDKAERQIDEVMQSLGLAPAEGDPIEPTPGPTKP
jgi:hypothetical protein